MLLFRQNVHLIESFYMNSPKNLVLTNHSTMKKSLFLIALALMFATVTEAQNRVVLLHESFDGMDFPEGWWIADEGTENWSVSATTMAGGFANEMKFSWVPEFDGVSRLVTYPVDLTGVSTVNFSFKHYYDNYADDPNTLGIATSSDGGNTWHVGWSRNYTQTGNYVVNEQIQTADMGHANVLFCIYYQGDSYDINNWYFDDIEAFTVEDFDLGITSVNLPSVLPIDDRNIGMEVFNYGLTPITSIQARYVVSGQAPVVETFSVNIPSMQKENLTFAQGISVLPGNYDVTISLVSVNGTTDNNPGNDVASRNIEVVIGSAERIEMIENFSSTTCGPCVVNNEALEEICANYPGRWTYTKFSTLGDPYCIMECIDRQNYYNVIGVPQTFLDAENQGFEPVQESAFVAHLDNYAFMDIRGSFKMEGSVLSMQADLMPYRDADATVFITVNEKQTVGNLGNNGERELFHVMMKMLPDPNGTPVTFVAGEVQHLEYSYDMASTNVEEMSDLEVAIWVQLETKEILNSRRAYEYTDVHPYPAENLMLTESGSGRLTASWSAPAQGNPLGYNVYVNRQLVLENTTALTHSFTVGPATYNVVEVEAVYPDAMTSVKRVTGLMSLEAVDDNETTMCMVYPNPANTQVRIETECDLRSVNVYDMLGNLVEAIPANGKSLNVSLSRFSNGVYLFSITDANGKVSSQRVVVTH